MRGFDRYRGAQVLRLLCGLFLVALALAVFRRPLTEELGGALEPVARQLPLPGIFRSAAPGFILRVTSEPRGARVRVDGTERGATPLFANVACQQGDEVAIAVEKEGFGRWRRVVECREGGELTVRARLGE